MPGHARGTRSGLVLRSRREACGLALRATARRAGVSPRALRRYERGERCAPPEVLERLSALLGPARSREDEVRRRLKEGPPRSLAAFRRSLPSSLRPVLEALVAQGELVEHRETATVSGHRRYARAVLAERTSSHERGLERAAPDPVPRGALRAARRQSGLRTAELASGCKVSPAAWRTWEARGVPVARVVEVGNALGAPEPGEIRSAREAAGWSQAELAHRVGVKWGAVQAWEQGTRRVPPGRIVLLRAALAEAAEALREALVQRVVDDVRSRPGVSESDLRHDHRSRGGRVRRESDYGAALDDAKHRRLVVEATVVTWSAGGWPTSRPGLFTPDQAPPRIKPMTGDELGRRRSALELTLDRFAELCGVSEQAVIRWERHGARPIPDHAAAKAREALRLAKDQPRPSQLRRRRLLERIAAAPGIAHSRLGGPGSGDTEVLERDLAALCRDGSVVRRETFDSRGRRYLGYYLPGAPYEAPERLAGAELRDLRERAGWSQAALARALGVRVHAVSRWEAGSRRVPPPRIADIRAALGGPAPRSPRDEAILAELETIARSRGGATRSQLGWPRRRRLIEEAVALGRLRAEEVPVVDQRGRTYRRELLFPPDTPARSEGAVPSMTPEEIRAARLRAGLSQAALGRLLGVVAPTVSGWERGKVRAPVCHLERLRELAGTPPRGGTVDHQADHQRG